MQFTNTQKRTATWCSIAIVATLAIWLLAPVLTPFVIAAVLAYALTPLVNWLVKICKGYLPRVLAVLFVELLLVVAILGLLLLVVPIVAKELPLMREQLPLVVDRLKISFIPWLAQFGIELSLDTASIKAFALKYLNANYEEALSQLMSSLKLGSSVALAIIGNAVLVPVALFYLLMEWDAFTGRLVRVVPPSMRRSFDEMTEEADLVLGQYLRGQLLVMLIMAVFYAVGLALFGLDLALPIGVFTGLAMFIPYVGFGIGLLLAILAGLLQFASLKALVMVAVVYGIGQVVESLYLTPRLVGERIGLHPLAVIFALLAFGQVFGFVGVLIALPASAVLLVAMRRIMLRYMSSKLYQG
jgi:predicted PurR-regulated permease PerM